MEMASSMTVGLARSFAKVESKSEAKKAA
jgi:hypothetical protein